MDSVSAKQFLITRVIEEAGLEHVPLSDIEQKMLYFTEVHPSSPDVNAEFEANYDSDEYEEKIIKLLRNSRERHHSESAQSGAQWMDAIDALKDEDHYILVMVYRAFPDYRKAILPTHRVRDYVIYIAIGIAVVLACIGVALWSR